MFCNSYLHNQVAPPVVARGNRWKRRPMMWSSLFGKGKSDKKVPVDKVVDALAEYSPKTANCTLVRTAEGLDVNEDFGRAFLFRYGDQLYVDDRAIYITTPDDIKAESGYHLDRGHILHLWFLHNRVPHTVDCQVVNRIRFPKEIISELDPRMPGAFKLKPVGTVRKSDKRSFLRFSHKPGRGALRVYAQIMFDLFVSKTNFIYPTQGGLPPRITDLKATPFAEANDLPKDPESVVRLLKNSLRGNPRDERVVFVNKPYKDDRSNRVSLVPLGHSSVLGLDAVREGEKTLFVKKPTNMKMDKKSPGNLTDGDLIVLGFNARSLVDSNAMEYFDLVGEIARIGTENLTVRPKEPFRRESGLQVELSDFSAGGIKVECSKKLLRYLLGEEYQQMPRDAMASALMDTAVLLNFYPKLRFNRETEIYRPEVPMNIPILAKIVRYEESPGGEGSPPEIRAFGIKFMYDPTEFSRDTFNFDRWERIRDVKENRHFQEIHNSLNGLIAFLESQNR